MCHPILLSGKKAFARSPSWPGASTPGFRWRNSRTGERRTLLLGWQSQPLPVENQGERSMGSRPADWTMPILVAPNSANGFAAISQTFTLTCSSLVSQLSPVCEKFSLLQLDYNRATYGSDCRHKARSLRNRVADRGRGDGRGLSRSRCSTGSHSSN